ncbi:MAG: LCCL domain-containing protein [Bacteroidota bacterium]
MKKTLHHVIVSLLFLSLLYTPFNTIAQPAVQATWATLANQYNTNTGRRYTFSFPPGGRISAKVWGSGVYTTDCSIASAAVHAGLISTKNGGTVTIEMVPGQSSYQGSVYNGVTSYDWGRYNSSFVFVNPGQLQQTYVPTVITGSWMTKATEYNNSIGQRFSFYFPRGGLVTGSVWGTGIYTTDCSIFSAAVHAGLITARYGGTVTIEILPGQYSYKGSTRNGVKSSDWGSFVASFRFVGQGRGY